MKRKVRFQAGQAIVIIALAGTLMLAGIGMAVDVVIGYLYSVATERAAAAAALSGVVFMPDQFNSVTAMPPGSRNDAWDRAIDEAKRNGYDPQDLANGISVTPSQVAGHPNRLQVTVSRNSPVFFMEIFGFRPYKVTKTVVAAYLPPISLGQPGSQLGSSLGELGRTRFMFMRTEGWGNDRTLGDAYTPSPFDPPAYSGATNDVHQISYANGTEPRDATVADRGGYNYQITIPSGGPGGVVHVYNAAYAPDAFGAGGPNYCDNDNTNPGLRRCSIGGNNWFHEDDDMWGTTSTNYLTMRYSLYRVTNVFIRSSDVLLSQLTVYPIDANNWASSSAQYRIAGGPRLGQTVTQQYSGSAPSNMLIYHNWVDLATYTGPQDGGLVVLQQTGQFGVYNQGGVLIPGTYRLRIDTLDNMGRSFSNVNTLGKKGYAVRAVNGDLGRTTCTTCRVTAWNDICLFTPFDTGSGGRFALPLFQLTPDYAGLTVSIDIWDVGDISSTTGSVRINILDPTGAVVSSPLGINIYDLGQQRSNLATSNYAVLASAPGNTTASFVAQDTVTGQSADNRWIHVEIPVPATYNPPPGQYWWSMQYVTGAGTVSYDTVTVVVGLKGGPVHLVS
jgi:hypothetical protein